MTDLHTEANQHRNPTTTPRLFDADGEVRVGDIVRFNKKPCYIEKIGRELVTVVTMDERKVTWRVLPQQINCVLQKDET